MLHQSVKPYPDPPRPELGSVRTRAASQALLDRLEVMRRDLLRTWARRLIPFIALTTVFVVGYGLATDGIRSIPVSIAALCLIAAIAAAFPLYELRQLRSDLRGGQVTEVAGPADLVIERRGALRSLHLLDARRLFIPTEVFDELRTRAQEVPNDRPEHLRLYDTYRIDHLTVIYAPASGTIVEIRDPDGAVIYREPALHGVEPGR